MSSSNQNAVAQGAIPSPVLSEQQWTQIQSATQSLTRDQLNWVSGYLAGVAVNAQQSHAIQTAPVLAETVAPASTLTILYGSQTGNAKGIAEDYKRKVEAQGIKANLVNMSDYKPRQIKNETHLVIIVSTHGEGDAPDDAVELHEFLGGKKAPKLPNLKYSVLGLGDTSYEFFCQTAKDFDARLAALGATAVHNRVDCDVDYENDAAAWGEAFLEKVKDDLVNNTSSQVVPLPGVTIDDVSAQVYTKKNPFAATLSESLKITGRDSIKDIRHIEISLEDSGMTYQPGDALGVWFKNDPTLVDELLSLLDIQSEQTVSIGDESMAIREALIEKLELTLSYPGFVKAYQQTTESAALAELMSDKAKLREYLTDRQIIDIVRDYPEKIEAQQLVEALRPLTPRLYSIASSQAEVEDEVHLTVGLVEYDAYGHLHQGGASGYLSKRLEEGGEVSVFIESNDNFRLPADPNTPVIMVGPGTGIAPFRAFMQQREADDSQGKNWLFFGNPHFTQDFLYQTEWQRYVKDGVLDKISLAFSRDQENKIYVQDRLQENGQELYEWLEQGAHFYVCGDASRMAKDVEQALLSVIEIHGNKSAEEAKQYLLALRKAKRYQKDVY